MTPERLGEIERIAKEGLEYGEHAVEFGARTVLDLIAALREAWGVIDEAIPLVNDEWEGTSPDSTGNKWLTRATRLRRGRGK